LPGGLGAGESAADNVDGLLQIASRLSILTERSESVGKTDAPDDSSYLKWRVDPTSPRERVLAAVVYAVGWGAQILPRHLTTNHSVIRGWAIAGLAVFLLGGLVALSKIHSY
jgi:hypothetical protein